MRTKSPAAARPETIRRMFAAIADRYDLNNRLHSLWRDQAWRRAAVREAKLDACPSADAPAVLDVACGTGDLAALFDCAGARRVVGVDFCEEMLQVARRRFGGREIEWQLGDATDLAWPDADFDVVSIAFGLRNVSDPARALSEFRRVLRPGGRAVVLEFDHPTGVLAPLVRWYLERVMPRTAAALAGDRTGAYQYLHTSVREFWTSAELADAMRRAGFEPVTTRRLTLGIAALHVGVRP